MASAAAGGLQFPWLEGERQRAPTKRALFLFILAAVDRAYVCGAHDTTVSVAWMVRRATRVRMWWLAVWVKIVLIVAVGGTTLV